MEYLKNYKHKETWGRRGKNFCIEICRWEAKGIDDVEYIWNVYCYIYKNHSMFNKLAEEDIFGGRDLDLHKGSTYCQWYRNSEGEVTIKQYGSDYNHWEDDEFLKIKNPEEAYEVFMDADRLFNQLSE